MFFSYFISGFIPLSSYMFWSVSDALKISIILSVFSLFLLGVIGAKMSKTSVVKNSLRMTAVGGILMLGIGLNILEIKKIKVANFLPSLFVIVILALIFT